MIKKLSFFLILMMLIPVLKISAKTQSVSNQSELKQALADNNITYIELNNNIETTEKINITRPVTIDGKGHTIEYVGTFKDGSSNNTVWSGIYVLQIYKTSATIKDIKLTGGNAGILVNGSTINLEGKIDVSGNGFGGIELSQGKNVTSKVKMILDDNAIIVNTTESKEKPTLWVPSDSDDATIEFNGITMTIKSGEELSVKEIEDLFHIENPNTIDLINIYLLIGIIGIFSFVIAIKNLKKLKEQ